MTATEKNETLTLLLSAVENTAVTAFKQDHELRYTWMFNPPANFAGDGAVGKTDADFLPPGRQLDSLISLKNRALSGESIKEVARYKDSYFMLQMNPERSQVGEIIGIEGIAVDVTELQRVRANLEKINRSLLKTMDSSLDFA